MTKIDILDMIVLALPSSRRQVELKTGLAKTTVFRRMEQLHEAGWCHISGWLPGTHGGHFQPIFKAGKGKDRECTLKAQSPTETQRRYREKARKSGAWEIRQARLSARYYAKKAAKKPHDWADALFAASKSNARNVVST